MNANSMYIMHALRVMMMELVDANHHRVCCRHLRSHGSQFYDRSIAADKTRWLGRIKYVLQLVFTRYIATNTSHRPEPILAEI